MKSAPNCLQPMWRLKNDSKKINVWDTLPAAPELNKSGDIPTGYAKEKQFKVGFSDSYFTWLSNNKPATQYLIEHIITDNFSETLIEDILTTLGIDDLSPQLVTNEVIEQTVKKTKRDPNFPKEILNLYDNQCCFCKLKIRLNLKPLNMEAAHIKWKARGGDCTKDNGLSLCPTHHLTFDRGVWTLNENYEIVISEQALINTQHDVFFTAFKGKSIADSIMDKSYLPNQKNLEWHRKSIFK